MTTALLHMKAEGFSESEVREHSLEWVLTASMEFDKRYRYRTSNEMIWRAMGYAATQGEEAAENFSAAMSQLRGDNEDDLSYLIDPNAKTDIEALQQFTGQPTGFGVVPPERKELPPMPKAIPVEEFLKQRGVELPEKSR